jgi:hypothetical protein
MLMLHKLQAQVKSGLENYHAISRGVPVTWMPVLHCMNKEGWYAEARYNYEDINTASVYMGKSFSGGHDLSFTITPMAGIIFGKYNGAALASNCDLNYKKIFFSGQLQYTLSKIGKSDNYFYQWLETGIQCTKWFFAGITVQQTKLYQQKMITMPGLMFGFQKKNITVPVYFFNPNKNNISLLLGIIIEWER